jgi:hypothetical protein
MGVVIEACIKYSGGRTRITGISGGGDVSGRYRTWPLQEAVTGSGRYRRPLQETGGGNGSGRYIFINIKNALRQDASTGTSFRSGVTVM